MNDGNVVPNRAENRKPRLRHSAWFIVALIFVPVLLCTWRADENRDLSLNPTGSVIALCFIATGLIMLSRLILRANCEEKRQEAREKMTSASPEASDAK